MVFTGRRTVGQPAGESHPVHQQREVLIDRAAAICYNQKKNMGGTNMNIWDKAQSVQLRVSETIEPGFDIGFDPKIPLETQREMRSFVQWVEDKYNLPITLWVDFEYRHYLISREGKRVGYLFYWADFSDYPVFNNPEDIPVIRLPVRTEHSTIEEILSSFIEAISDYFMWICNGMHEGYNADENDVEEILQAYLCSRVAELK